MMMTMTIQSKRECEVVIAISIPLSLKSQHNTMLRSFPYDFQIWAVSYSQGHAMLRYASLKSSLILNDPLKVKIPCNRRGFNHVQIGNHIE